MTEKRPWWQDTVVYQIYPRSFQDSDGDGVGDLRGITQRIDYLARLGIGTVWISPIYPSPMADFGYDVADYCGIDPLFGSLGDLDALVGALHDKGLKLILDLVPNHSSSAHPWFQESRSSRNSPRRDWYIWRDPAPDGGPPNNWVSQAGGSAWELDPATGQYYYHAFLKEQPDLNWRNPEVRAAIYDAMRFWLDRGIDGFRVDVIWHMMKDAQFRDDPPNPDFRPGDPPFKQLIPIHSADAPGVLDIAREMRAVLAAYPGDRLLIGETYLDIPRLADYYGPQLDAVHMPFNFHLIWASWQRSAWRPEPLMRLIESYEAVLPAGAWPNWVMGNHDQPRVATRLGPAQARVAMMLLLTLRGTPTIYQGDELGLANVAVPPEREQDPFGKRMPGTGQGRDPMRTPMPWDASRNCGFTTGEPWLPLGAGRERLSVAAEDADSGSMLHLAQTLLKLRAREQALSRGSWAPLAVKGDVLAYAREHEGRRAAVLLNLASEPRVVDLPPSVRGPVRISTLPGRAGRLVTRQLDLAADEGVVIMVAAEARSI